MNSFLAKFVFEKPDGGKVDGELKFDSNQEYCEVVRDSLYVKSYVSNHLYKSHPDWVDGSIIIKQVIEY